MCVIELTYQLIGIAVFVFLFFTKGLKHAAR